MMGLGVGALAFAALDAASSAMVEVQDQEVKVRVICFGLQISK